LLSRYSDSTLQASQFVMPRPEPFTVSRADAPVSDRVQLWNAALEFNITDEKNGLASTLKFHITIAAAQQFAAALTRAVHFSCLLHRKCKTPLLKPGVSPGGTLES
jgi:hypothetical protein